MTEMNMVERVARAIHFRGDDQGDDAWDHCQTWLRMAAREQARAAIEAMREPTTEMKFCGIQEEAYGIDATWKAMIDTALKEDRP